MIIKSVSVRHFRSVDDETLDCDVLTVLVGVNGSGKSAFLRAIELFYAPDPKVSLDDVYNRDEARDIEITLTFEDLPEAAKHKFSKYIQEETLTVTRVLSAQNGRATYHGNTLQHPPFADIRAISGARDLVRRYNEVRQQPQYSALPAVRSRDDALRAMGDWEDQHPDSCEWRRDNGQFFGFREVAQGYLGEFTRFILVPAVRDAVEDAAEGRGSAITELMDLVVRSVLAERDDLKELKERIQREYEDIVDPSKVTELDDLGSRLTNTLRAYVPDAAVGLDWLKAGDIQLPPPKADVKLVEDGFSASVGRTGHGLQRAFIVTLLQHLAMTQAQSREAPEPEAGVAVIRTLPSLVIAIEEPELYQHPNRQRHIARVLRDLATGTIPGVAARTQIIYATHSPLFVGIDRLDQIRLARKVDADSGQPKQTRLLTARLEDIAGELCRLNAGDPDNYTSASLRARLQSIMTPWMNEGFFADVAVLVEGEDDRAAILGVAAHLGYDLEAEGIAIIPCMGKTNIDRPLLIFRKLGIPTYAVSDSDRGGGNPKTQTNRLLLRMHGTPEEDYPSMVTQEFACFETTLEAVLRSELGNSIYDTLLAEVGSQLGMMRRNQTMKNPVAIREVLRCAAGQGKTSSTLESVVKRIVALRYNAAAKCTGDSSES